MFKKRGAVKLYLLGVLALMVFSGCSVSSPVSQSEGIAHLAKRLKQTLQLPPGFSLILQDTFDDNTFTDDWTTFKLDSPPIEIVQEGGFLKVFGQRTATLLSESGVLKSLASGSAENVLFVSGVVDLSNSQTDPSSPPTTTLTGGVGLLSSNDFIIAAVGKRRVNGQEENELRFANLNFPELNNDANLLTTLSSVKGVLSITWSDNTANVHFVNLQTGSEVTKSVTANLQGEVFAAIGGDIGRSDNVVPPTEFLDARFDEVVFAQKINVGKKVEDLCLALNELNAFVGNINTPIRESLVAKTSSAIRACGRAVSSLKGEKGQPAKQALNVVKNIITALVNETKAQQGKKVSQSDASEIFQRSAATLSLIEEIEGVLE